MGNRTVTVAAPMCTPGRRQVLTALSPYGFKDLRIDQSPVYDKNISLYYVVKVRFTARSARWGEYVLCRAGFRLLSQPIDPRNERWAARHSGPPVAWRLPGCKADKPAARRSFWALLLGSRGGI